MAFDYTREESWDDFELADVATIDKSAEEIEAERSFKDIPVGEHELVVVGLVKAPKEESKDVWVNGRRTSLKTFNIALKLALPDDPSAQVVDFFQLPPSDLSMLTAYQEGTKAQDSKPTTKGFMATKFYHFIQRLGYAFPKGGRLPAEALRIANWKGRRIIAEIVARDPEIDQATGMTRAKSNQVKLFSYRPSPNMAGDSQSAKSPQPRPATTTGQPTARQQAQPAGKFVDI